MIIGAMSKTEFEFKLPKGLVDAEGEIHTQGIMRLATAKDEMDLQKQLLVQGNTSYAVLVRLSQVISRLGSLPTITPELLENLFILDLAYLREFYNRINQYNDPSIAAQCPRCQLNFAVGLVLAGES
jgi:hypothetical protein